MTESSVFLISETWLDPSKSEEFKSYRIRLLDLIEKFSVEFVYHGHPFAWTSSADDGKLPTGIEICRFETEKAAKQALDAIEKSGLLSEGNMIFDKTRCYLAKYARASGKSV